MRICLLGMDNMPALSPAYRQHAIGGESVQQTLLGRALARRGHDVSMVVADDGQSDGAQWGSIRVFKAYRRYAGLPVLRFIYPRWTRMWAALRRADADVYYTSCAGMQVGLLALFCWRHRRRFVFRTASDSDCDASRLLVRYARDRWLYGFGLRRADAILVQSAGQAQALARNYGLRGRVASMLVERPKPPGTRDIDVLWVGNIREVKRPDRVLDLAARLPWARFHMVGGVLPRERALFDAVFRAAATHSNVTFHGRRSYWETNDLYARAKILVNTSDVEGFPNAYLQAWVRGVPVVSMIDPDGVIEREGLGIAVESPDELPAAIRHLLDDPVAWRAASDRCYAFMAREYAEDAVLDVYLDTFASVLRRGGSGPKRLATRDARHA